MVAPAGEPSTIVEEVGVDDKVSVAVLGPVEVSRRGLPLDLGGAKQRALLARLAVSAPAAVSVDALVEDLWNSAPREPTRALQQHVSRLRANLPVERRHGGYRLAPESVVVDVTTFKQLSARGQDLLKAGAADEAAGYLDRALTLWRGTAFADLAPNSGMTTIATHLEHLRQSVEIDRNEAYLACGRGPDLIPELQRLTGASPLVEAFWAHLMAALYQHGRIPEALAAFHAARSALVGALGHEPGERLTEIHRALLVGAAPPGLADSPGAPAVPASPASPTVPAVPAVPTLRAEQRPRARARANRDDARPGLPGRRRELEILESAWREARRGLRVVTITGELGIGKSRLAEEFASRLAREGARVRYGRCDDDVESAYQPFADILAADIEHVAGTDATRARNRLGPDARDLLPIAPALAPLLPGPGEGTDPATQVHRVRAALTRWLIESTRVTPMVWVIDDLHWSSPETTALLEHLIRSARSARVLVLITLRDRDDPGTRRTPERFLPVLRQSEVVTQLSLGRLDRSATRDVVLAEVAGGGGEASEQLVDRIQHASGGLPLFVLELMRQLRTLPGEAAPGTVAPADPRDAGRPPLGAIPPGLRTVIHARLETLPRRAREVLEQAAVLGRRFELELLAQVYGDEDRLDDALSAAVYARLIEADGQPWRYVFCHDVVRAMLYEEIAPLRRARLHARAAAALEAAAAANPYARAHHSERAAPIAGPDRAVTALALAGEAALDQRAPGSAERFYRRALALADTTAERSGSAQYCDLLIGLGRALFGGADPAYRDTLLEAGRLARRLSDHDRLVTAVLANSRGWYASTVGLDHERVAQLEDALAACPADRHSTRARLLGAWAVEIVRDTSRREEALERSARALELAEGAGDERILGQLLSDRYAVMYASFEDPAGCVELNRRLERLARRRGDEGLELSATIGLAQSALTVGDGAEADRALARALGLADTLNEPARLWMTRCWQATRTAGTGDLASARAQADAALELGTASGQPDAHAWYAGQMFMLLLHAGGPGDLRDDSAEQALRYAAAIPAWRAAHALALAHSGAHDQARALLAEFVDSGFSTLPRDMLWLHGMAYLCQAAAALGDAPSARLLAGALAPYERLVADNGTIDAGPMALHLAAVTAVAGDREQAARLLDVAARVTDRLRAPIWHGHLDALRRRLTPQA
ncbi:AfsR/SARP family transcriptional regulator [Pseudactinotalea sp. HY158]|uniref:AfsR/SARP family transcriptional regulator n=1 Tax=Pseudactinotalea sp. HY158 TaxID=2654547 RepID=UPI0018927AB7|nr:AfsR/SARP family transcriptional regulator [Pseudactinotalea sp. HY158]